MTATPKKYVDPVEYAWLLTHKRPLPESFPPYEANWGKGYLVGTRYGGSAQAHAMHEVNR